MKMYYILIIIFLFAVVFYTPTVIADDFLDISYNFSCPTVKITEIEPEIDIVGSQEGSDDLVEYGDGILLLKMKSIGDIRETDVRAHGFIQCDGKIVRRMIGNKAETSNYKLANGSLGTEFAWDEEF